MIRKQNLNGTHHLKEIDKGIDRLNVWFVVNTLATIITGIAAVILAFLMYLK